MRGSISYLNLKRRPGRTAALVALSAFLCFSALAGSLFVSGLKSGLDSLESRLGADIMVVPYEATTKSSLQDIILQGNPGYFYMDRSVLDEVKETEGIGEISTQTYLATTTSSCCSVSVQIIAFDPETDFTIRPWVESSYKSDLGYMEVFVGCELNAFAGDELSLYGETVTVTARLDRTGTYLDTSIYASEETIKQLIRSAMDKKLFNFEDVNPDDVISCIMINAADGCVAEDVLNDINLHVRGVSAIKTSDFLSDVSSKLAGISGVVSALAAVIWILALAVLILAFAMITNERKKELATLRVMGASRKKTRGVILKEGLIVGVSGSVCGALVALCAAFVLANAIESSLGMPFLLPGAAGLIIRAVVCAALAAAAASAGAFLCAARISREDTAVILREE